jgi:glycosyltransferase involved in cell wall biosynthesis
MTRESDIRVLHVITRLIVGGAQENTMLTADILNRWRDGACRYNVDVVSGPQTGSEGSLIEEIRARGIPLKILPCLRREISPVNDLKALFELQRMMATRNGTPRFDIVHTHSSKAGILGRIAAKRARIPLIIHTVHGWSFHDRMSALRRKVYVELERWAATHSDALITVTLFDIEKGLSHRIGRREDYVVIRSGIELDRFGSPDLSGQAVRNALGIPPQTPVVGSVTRLSPQKAPLDLVDAWAKVHRERPEAHFVIVGDGPLRQAVENRIEALEITDCVTLTGLRRDVPELMAAFDVFVLSSLWEGLPRVLPQAMAAGLPIVCTHADGTAEAIVDAEHGFLVPRSKPEELAAKVLLLLGNPNLRTRLGEIGRQRSAEFGAKRMVEQIEELYRSRLATLAR